MELADKVAVVTGAAGGIGSEVARKFAAAGARVVLTDLDEAKLISLKKELGQSEVMIFPGDITGNTLPGKIVEEAIKKFARIDILINSAGVCEFVSMQEITAQSWDRLLAINLKSVFFLSRAVMEVMKKQQSGKIINIASSAAENGGILAGAHYCAAKAGVINLTKSLARVLASSNVQVNVVSPGPVDTQMIEVLSKEQKDEYVSHIPLKRMATAEDIARAIFFLAGPSSDYITGQMLRVNGGLIMA